MSIESEKVTKLMQSLESLSNDNRLSRVFSRNSSDACDLTLWLLEIKKSKKEREYRLIYAWIIPRLVRDLNYWSISTLLDKSKLKLYRLTFHHYGQVIFDLIKELCHGNNLASACCQQLGLKLPLRNGKNDPCGQFCIGLSSQAVANSFSVRPVIFVQPTWFQMTIMDEFKSISSPNEVVPAFVGSLSRLGKMDLFQVPNDIESSQYNDFVKDCLVKLKEETGLDFCGTDSKRLGNIEWFCFPAADDYEKAEVKISFDSPAYTANIKISSGTIPIGTQVTIRCRLYNDREVSLDRLKFLHIFDEAKNVCASFTTQQQITKYMVTIWIKAEDQDIAEIWYESSSSLLKQIKMSQGLIGFQGRMKSDFLQQAANNNQKLKEQVEQAEIVTQTHYEQYPIRSNQIDPWIMEGEEVYSSIKNLFSKPSEALFVKKNNWADMEPGKFTFLNWLKDVTDDDSASEVLIVDPFFDETGISEVIARVGAVQAEYIVMANTQVNSSYPEDPNLEREPDRATRLKDMCKTADIQLLLSRLKFQLLDVRSLTETKKQLFHDRYIIVYNKERNLKAGYHLSNSIQGATNDHPLLITPIPFDVLGDVAAYIQELRNPPPDKKYKVIPLYPFRESSTNKQNGEIEEKPSETLEIETDLNELIEKLINSDESDKFTQLWQKICICLNHSCDVNDYLNKIIDSGGIGPANKLEQMLIAIPEKLALPIKSFKAETHLEAKNITDLMKLNFAKAIRESDYLLISIDAQMWSICLEDNGISYATQVIGAVNTEKLVQTISKLQQSFANIDNNESEKVKKWNYKHTITFVLKQVIHDVLKVRFGYTKNSDFLPFLLKSDIPLVRAIAVRSLYYGNSTNVDYSQVFSTISVLPPLEQLYTLAEWIFELRRKANCQEKKENEDLKKLRQDIFTKMRQCFPKNISDSKFKRLVCRLSGPSRGDWSISTTEDFLMPLVKNDKLRIDRVTELWLSFLFNKFEIKISSKYNKQKKKEDKKLDIIFYDLSYGIELIQVAAWAMVNSQIERKNYWLDQIIELQQKAQNILAQPFLRYRNYQYWNRISLCLLWLALLTSLVLEYKNVNHSWERCDDLFQLAESTDKILDATLEEHPMPIKKWLWETVSSYRKIN
jgi:hypothetical protein